MDRVGGRMHGLSLHYYTVSGWNGSKGAATRFSKDDYYWTLGKCREIEDVIKKHCTIMDKYDPQKNVALMLDEWGTWWDTEPGTNPDICTSRIHCVMLLSPPSASTSSINIPTV